MSFMRATPIVASLLLLSACVSNPPKPTISEYVKTEGGGFAIDRTDNGSQVSYGMTYSLLRRVGENPSATVEFENPQKDSNSLVVEKEIIPGEDRLVIASPPLPCIENNRTYIVTLKLFANGGLVAEHKDQVQFSVPGNMQSQLNLTWCK